MFLLPPFLLPEIKRCRAWFLTAHYTIYPFTLKYEFIIQTEPDAIAILKRELVRPVNLWARLVKVFMWRDIGSLLLAARKKAAAIDFEGGVEQGRISVNDILRMDNEAWHVICRNYNLKPADLLNFTKRDLARFYAASKTIEARENHLRILLAGAKHESPSALPLSKDEVEAARRLEADRVPSPPPFKTAGDFQAAFSAAMRVTAGRFGNG